MRPSNEAQLRARVPFRFSGGVFYTYALPGHADSITTYTGDLINTRFIAEYIVNEERGFGFNLEFATVHGISRRLDGHPITVNPANLSLYGFEPAVQYKFGPVVGAAGVLFSVAGQNDITAIYSNISLYYYWGKDGEGVMQCDAVIEAARCKEDHQPPYPSLYLPLGRL